MLTHEEKKKQKGKVLLSPQSGLYLLISVQKFNVKACVFSLFCQSVLMETMPNLLNTAAV